MEHAYEITIKMHKIFELYFNTNHRINPIPRIVHDSYIRCTARLPCVDSMSANIDIIIMSM